MPDTPTPTPALTDEQIDAAIEEVVYGYAFNRGGGPGRQFATDTIAAVIARAERKERERIAAAIDAVLVRHGRHMTPNEQIGYFESARIARREPDHA